MNKEPMLEYVEAEILENVKFLSSVLEEVRKRNKMLEERLGVSYGKFIGIATPYEEMVAVCRTVKGEFDQYLEVVRELLREKYTKNLRKIRKK